MTRLGFAFLVAASIAAVGCVLTTHHTIDARITVEIRQIKEEADSFLDYIEGQRETLPGMEEDTSWFKDAIRYMSPVRVAHAAELRSTSPLVRQILDRMRERHPRIQALKDSRCLGESNRGYVELRECDALSDPEKLKEAQELVAAENANRRDLYREIARLNQEGGVTVGVVERIYAQRRLDRAQPGEIFELPPAGEPFDEFMLTPMARRLGEEARPGAWVTIK